jgi:phosphohistidine phosphatase
MKDASETSRLGSHFRRDGEAAAGKILRWPQQLISGISGSPAHESALEDAVCDNSTVSNRDENDMGDGEDIGYGSINRYKSQSSDEESFRSSNRNDAEVEVERRKTSNAVERLQHQHQQRRSLMARMVALLVCLSCFCLAFFGKASFEGAANTLVQSPIRGDRAQVFFFDTLFGGIKKRPSRDSLERPPPLARSILLVLRAETTPTNPAVHNTDRQITARGMQDAEGLGMYLQQHKIPEPDWIFVSPSERTAFTTELVRRHWAADAPVAFEDILYTLEFNDYFSFVAGLNDQFRRVMIVGHNPAILNTAKKLMRTHGIEDFPDCGLMEIRWNDLVKWSLVEPFSGSSKMAIDPNNNFFFSSPQ